MLTTFDDDEYVYSALRAGASGFLVKDMALDSILDAVRVLASGDALIAPSITRRLIAEFAIRPEPGVGALQPRRQSPAGRRHRARARSADAGRPRPVQRRDRRGAVHQRGTAKAHVARLFTKLAARDRVQLVIMAYEAGLVSPSR